jgi:hypothetical protein
MTDEMVNNAISNHEIRTQGMGEDVSGTNLAPCSLSTDRLGWPFGQAAWAGQRRGAYVLIPFGGCFVAIGMGLTLPRAAPC